MTTVLQANAIQKSCMLSHRLSFFTGSFASSRGILHSPVRGFRRPRPQPRFVPDCLDATASTPLELSLLDTPLKVRVKVPCVIASPLQAVTKPSPMALDKRVGLLGSGQMAEALANGLVKKGVLSWSQICCTDPVQARRDLFTSYGATAYETSLEVVKNSQVLFVAVKPQHVAAVLTESRPHLKSDHVIISIAAGITLEKLQDAAGPEARVVRVMPNTPCLVGETAAAMSLGVKATAEDEKLVRTLFEAVGKIYTVDEKLLSAVTGLSGSGPAYVFMIVEALADGGVKAGLPRDIAQALAAQTVLGSAKMVLETGKHPGALKDMVTSPAGTTIAGVHELEKGGLRACLISAVVAATDRANQLAKL